MADYYPLLSRAIAGMVGKPASDRIAIYARAREALERQLRGFEPSLAEQDIRTELDSLEATIARVEAENAILVQPEHDAEPAPVGNLVDAPDPADETPPDGSADASAELPATVPDATPDATDTRPVIEPTLRPRMPQRREDDGRGKPLALFAGIAIVAMLVMGLVALTRNESPKPPAAPPVISAQGGSDSSKTEGRLVDPSPKSDVAQAPASPPRTIEAAKTTPATPETKPALPVMAPSTISRAFMVLEVQAGSPNQFEGRANWTFAPDPGLKGEKALRALIEFPAGNLGVDFSIARNKDAALNASHTVMVIFEPKNGMESIREMSTVEWRERESQTGAVLAGIIVPVQDNVFMIGLDRSDATRDRNLDLLRTQKWMVFEIRFANGRRGAILVEKGTGGDKAINDALAEWK